MQTDHLRSTVTTLSLLLPICACAGPGPTEEPPQTSTPKPLSAEPRVTSGINDVFLDEGLDVEAFTRRFEGESREVYVLRETIVDALRLEAGMSVADIGSGTGLFLKPIAEGIGPRGTLYAVEISPVFIEHLRRRAAEEGLPQVQPVLCGMRSADLPPASIDLAFICDTYHHFEYPSSTLASLMSALRPGGSLVVVDFERIPGVTKKWLLEHVRAGKEVFRAEIEAAGFIFEEEPELGLQENYFLRFRRP